MTWATGRIRETRKGFRALLDHSTERFTTRAYKDASSARSIANNVAAKLGWSVDWMV